MKFRTLAERALLSASMSALAATGAFAADIADQKREEILVTAARETSEAGTKTNTPLLETPQPISIIKDDVFLAQGALSVSDTLRYSAGIAANPYGQDSRVDGGLIRGINAAQFRDGMQDIFSYYASIRSDPYNFSQVEVVRGPASVLFGSGSIGGLVNLVSKTPSFDNAGEISLRYGSHDRMEALGDVTGAITDNIAGRLVMRVRDSDTQTDNVQDDRIMLAPSLTWRLGDDTNLKFIGLYQQDKSGSTAQFLPLVGTILPNPNGQLDNSLFIGKPGWDRYNGTLMQGSVLFDHRFNDNVKLNLKARAVDSDLTYLTHYPNSYSNPASPYLDPAQRRIGLYADGSYARMNIFSTDNNVQLDFNTSDNIEHKVLVGVDYSWNRVQKTGGFALEEIDIYDIDYDAIPNYGGGLPTMFGISTTDVRQEQLGVYVQDQIKFFDKISVVLGVRRDEVDSRTIGGASESSDAWSKRAGIIAEVAPGFSPFVSYTESFEPISGLNSGGAAFKPKRGKQFEGGLKFHPDDVTLVTATAFHIEESNRPVDDPSTPDPFDQMQAGSLTSEGFEVEASRMLPGKYELIAAYSYVKAQIEDTNVQLDDVPKTTASLWGTKSFALPQDATLRLGAGVRYVGSHKSYSAVFPDGIKTPNYTLVDALAEVSWDKWKFALNATNLFDKEFYSACLARGDCFMGEAQNIYGTLTYRY